MVRLLDNGTVCRKRAMVVLVLVVISNIAFAQDGRWVTINSQGSALNQTRTSIYSPVERDGDVVRFWVRYERISPGNFLVKPNGEPVQEPESTETFMRADCRSRTLAAYVNANLLGPADFVAPGSLGAKILAAVCDAD
jgi:hypothetical protein